MPCINIVSPLVIGRFEMKLNTNETHQAKTNDRSRHSKPYSRQQLFARPDSSSHHDSLSIFSRSWKEQPTQTCLDIINPLTAQCIESRNFDQSSYGGPSDNAWQLARAAPSSSWPSLSRSLSSFCFWLWHTGGYYTACWPLIRIQNVVSISLDSGRRDARSKEKEMRERRLKGLIRDVDSRHWEVNGVYGL